MAGTTKKLPNILLLYSDQHNARVLGCYGNSEVKTPNLDKLALEGVRFTNAYTNNPICTPSRMCIMSGQYVHNFGYYGLMGRKPQNLPHIFQYLKKSGYMTGMAGKIHTPRGWLSDYCDYVGDALGQEALKSNYSTLNLPGAIRNTSEYSLYINGLGLGDKTKGKTLDSIYNKDGKQNPKGLDSTYSQIPAEHSCEAWTANVTNAFIEKANEEGKPFCFWMTLQKPHQPYTPAKEFWDMYDESKLTLPPNSENNMEDRYEGARSTQEKWQKSGDWRAFQPDDWESTRRRVLRGYYANVTQVDDAVGRVLTKLDELGIREDTIILYTTDHGEFAGEHGMIEKAPGIGFKCVTNIPFIWSWKGHLPENMVCDSLAESVDFLPTVCSLAGIPAPDWVDGKDISNALVNGEDIRDVAVTENPYTRTIHTKKFKLTQYIPDMCEGKDFGELYDIEKDPWEMENLYFKPEYQQVVQELRYKLYCWLVSTSRFITVNPTIPGAHDNDPLHGKSWDEADRSDIYNEDRKIGIDFCSNMILRKITHYL